MRSSNKVGRGDGGSLSSRLRPGRRSGEAELQSINVGLDGEAIVLGRYRNQLQVAVADQEGHQLERMVALWPGDLHVPVAQRRRDGAIVVVGRRCRKRPDGSHDPSATIYLPDGSVIGQFLTGDGIKDVQITADDHLCVS